MEGTLRRQLWRVALVFALAAIIIISPVWGIIQRVAQPWLTPLVNQAGRVFSYVSVLGRAHSLEAENEQLRQELAAWQSRSATYEQLLQENNRLRELAGFIKPAGVTVVGVEVIGEEVDESGKRYLLNRGSKDGLVVGQPLVAGIPSAEGSISAVVLVGTVVEVSQSTSSFILTTSPESHILAEVVNNERSQGLLVGEFSLGIRLTYLPPNDIVQVGTQVVTSNLQENVPSGILIGSITTIEKTEGEFFQTAIVVPPIPLERFRFLYVLQRNQP